LSAGVDLLAGDIFRNAARAVPAGLAAATVDHRLTFGALDRGSNQIARAFAELGVGLGSRVVTWTDNSIDLVPVFAALAKSGAVFAPTNGRLGLEEVTPSALLARPSLLVVDHTRTGDAAELATRLGVPWVLADTVTGAGEAPGPDHSLTVLADRCSDAALDPVDGLTERDPHVVFFTSGSTGRPKGAMISHRATVLRSHPGSQLEPRGALVCPFPLFHMAAWTLSMQQWHARDAIVYAAPDGMEICAAVERHQAARVYLIPAVARRVLDHLATSEGAARDMSGVRFADTGTSATPPELLREMAAAFPNATLRVFYGSTEAANVAALEQVDFERKPGSCGTPSPLTEVRRSDDGELQVRNAVLFDGYFGDAEATANAVTADGWYRTGDRAEVDAEGFFTITGRVHDVIRSGGESVAPLEVEAVLRTHPAIVDVAVIGVPDPQWGEVVCAVIAVAGSEAPTLAELREHCAAKLASHKHPRRLLVVDEIPRTQATMQVQRPRLVELALAGA
jgi:acyl-CoA synthetase (AMP-forming)/AMP-acid ligase II